MRSVLTEDGYLRVGGMSKSGTHLLMPASGFSNSLSIGNDSILLTPAAETRNHSLIVMMSRAAAWKCGGADDGIADGRPRRR